MTMTDLTPTQPAPAITKSKAIERKPLPALAIELWHPTLNVGIDIEKVSGGSGLRFWWLGKCGHEWRVQLSELTRCPYCANKRLLVGFNDLATTNPELVKEWHPTKNGDKTASDVMPGNTKRVWWQCAKGHEWSIYVRNRAKEGYGCPFCSNKSVWAGFNDLATTHPDIAAEWDYEKNYPLKPTEVTFGKPMRVFWIGAVCWHSYTSQVKHRVDGHGCSVCSGHTVLVGFNDLATTFPEIAAEWHPTLNGLITPQDITGGLKQHFYWLGKGCGHSWESSVGGRTKGGYGCHFCSGRYALAGFNDLASQYPEVAATWHLTKNGAHKPQEITSGSSQRTWWVGKCGHEWKASVSERTQGRGCPFCSNQRFLLGFNDIISIAPLVAAEWHPTKNKGFLLKDLMVSDKRKMWWVCQKGHEWRVPPRSRCIVKSNCPECSAHNYRSAAEDEILQFLEGHGLKVTTNNRKALGGKREIDLYIEYLHVGIEYNGVFWHDENHKKKDYHLDKFQRAKKAGITLLQIWESDYVENPVLLLNSLASVLGIDLQPLLASQISEVAEGEGTSYYAQLNGANSSNLLVAERVGSVVTVRNGSLFTCPLFSELLSYLEETLLATPLEIMVDNCWEVYSGELEKFSYVAAGITDLEYSYVIQQHLIRPTTVLNRPKIWDAGRTRWIKAITD